MLAYVERAQLFFEANDVAEAKQVPVFLSAIGARTYTLLRNLLTPILTKDKTFDEIVTVLKQHYELEPLAIAEQFNLNKSWENR